MSAFIYNRIFTKKCKYLRNYTTDFSLTSLKLGKNLLYNSKYSLELSSFIPASLNLIVNIQLVAQNAGQV